MGEASPAQCMCCRGQAPSSCTPAQRAFLACGCSRDFVGQRAHPWYSPRPKVGDATCLRRWKGRGSQPTSSPRLHLQFAAQALRRMTNNDEALLCKGSRFGGGPVAGGRVCGGWVKVDACKVPSTSRVKIWKVSRLGAQRVTAKSKLLARQMPRVCSGGLRVDSEAAKSLKVAPAQSGSKSMRRSSPRDL